jgi:hypothetical protein
VKFKPPMTKDSNPHFKKVGERLAEWVRSLGIDERVAPNHGWRHRFSSVARFVAMPEDVRNIIQGHAGVTINPIREAPGWRYITLQVAEIDELHAGLRSRGVREGFAPVTLGDVARISMILDPDGNWIELSRRASIVGSLS